MAYKKSQKNIKSKIQEMRRHLERKKGRQEQLKAQLQSNRRKLRKYRVELEASNKAQEAIHHVAKLTQQELEFHLSDIVSMGMSGIFPDPYSLVVEFISRRGRVEVDMLFERDGYEVDPLSATGGGAVDVASLALRFSAWTLKNPRTRPVILLDEPLKWLKGSDLPRKGAEMIKEISQHLNLQIAMISHDPELIEGADRVFDIGIKKGVSYIRS